MPPFFIGGVVDLSRRPNHPRPAPSQGRRPTPPGDRSNGSPPTSPREKKLGRVREDPLLALPPSLGVLAFLPRSWSGSRCRCHPTSRRRPERCQRKRSLAAFGPAFVSAARLPSTQRRKPQARQHPQRPSRKFSPTSPNNNGYHGFRRYDRAKSFH